MKVLVKILGVVIIGVIVSYVIIYLTNTCTIINELNEASSLAMKQTQNIMADKIIKDYDSIGNDIFKDINYENYYRKCFEDTVIDKDIYDLSIETDENKGMIYVEIDTPNYKLIPTKKLLNIVDIYGDELNNIDSYRYETSSKTTKYKPGKSEKDFTPRTIYSLPLEVDGNVRTYSNYKFVIFASNGNSTVASSIAGPHVVIRCTDKDDNVNVIQEAEAGAMKMTTLTYKGSCDCKLFEVVLPEGVDTSKYPIKLDTLNINFQSTITEIADIKVLKADFHILDYVNIENRYINDLSKLNNNSIWIQNDEYKNKIEYYIEKLK